MKPTNYDILRSDPLNSMVSQRLGKILQTYSTMSGMMSHVRRRQTMPLLPSNGRSAISLVAGTPAFRMSA